MITKKDYSIFKHPISIENISRISELIVLRAIKTHCGYNHMFDKLYKGLLCDIFDKKKDNFSFSDAYDLVQDVNIFLLSHVGRFVDDVLYFDKKGFPITICKACFKIVDRYAWIQVRDSKIFSNLEEVKHCDILPKPNYNTDYEYFKLYRTVKSMNLTLNERKTLYCFYYKMSMKEMSRRLSVCFQAVYLRRKKIRQKYLLLKR